MKSNVTASSSQPSAAAAVEEIRQVLAGQQPKVVLFFASPKYPLQEVGSLLEKHFPSAKVMGASTAGEICTGKLLKQSVVAMSMDGQLIQDIEVAVVENISRENNVPQAMQRFSNHFGQPVDKADPQDFVGLILIDGLRAAEEKIIEKISGLTDVPFVGGSAGDDLQFKETRVFAAGRSYTDAAVLALLKPHGKFEILKTQSFKVLPKKLTATRVDEAKRIVFEFNHQPAVQAYAEALGVKPDDLANHFMHNPLGLMVEGQPFVRSPQQIQGQNIVFYCSILNGTEYSLLESADIVQDTRKSLEAVKKSLGQISAIINFHCILRTIELEKKQQTEAYGKLFSASPTIGLSTYGEQYFAHINQTSTMLIFK